MADTNITSIHDARIAALSSVPVVDVAELVGDLVTWRAVALELLGDLPSPTKYPYGYDLGRLDQRREDLQSMITWLDMALGRVGL